MRCARCEGKPTPCAECQKAFKAECLKAGHHVAQRYGIRDDPQRGLIVKAVCWCGDYVERHYEDPSQAMVELAQFPLVAVTQ